MDLLVFLGAHPSLLDFYKKYNSLKLQFSADARNEWFSLLSDLEKKIPEHEYYYIKYRSPEYHPSFEVCSELENLHAFVANFFSENIF